MTGSGPQNLFDNLKFVHTWRPYQRDVLEQLSRFLADEKIHIVAAPGAGKTILGLEILRQLGKPCLILAPSLTIRAQWIDRLCTDFLSQDEPPDWVSTEIENPGLITVETYQKFAQVYRADAPFMDTFGVLILDEAHHLRNVWWEALADAVERFSLQTVALTATPPFDADDKEWQRYLSLCGEIDYEISIPQLVKTGTLCPHQDLVYLSSPSDLSAYKAFTERSDALFDILETHPELAELVRHHPWINRAREHAHDALENVELFSAMLIFHFRQARSLSSDCLRVLGLGRTDIPRLNWQWLEILLNGLKSELPEPVLTLLHEHGSIVRENIRLCPTVQAGRLKLLENTPGKLDSIVAIHGIEQRGRQNQLRQVILCDHIGSGYIRQSQPSAQNGLTCTAVFDALKEHVPNHALAVLTGSIVIVPLSLSMKLGLSGRVLPSDDQFFIVESSGVSGKRLTSLLTEALHDGDLKVLIGTQALLGQGWDAPCVNSLVIATRLSSYVSVNQMRGRALRRDKAIPDKVANIWHLASTVSPKEGEEIDLLQKRFSLFATLDRRSGAVHSGLNLLSSVEDNNADAQTRAHECSEVSRQWQAAVTDTPDVAHVRKAVKTTPGSAHYLGQPYVSRKRRRVLYLGGAIWVSAMFAIGTVVFLPGLLALGGGYGVSKLLSKTVLQKRIGRKFLERIGRAVIHTCASLNRIYTDPADISLDIELEDDEIGITISGATLPEEDRIMTAIRNLIDPVSSPRYLLAMGGKRAGAGGRIDLAIPELFGRRREDVQTFMKCWHKYVGPGQAIYTRTVNGRAILQAARLKAARHVTKAQQELRWR